jgi:hypothetical protein
MFEAFAIRVLQAAASVEQARQLLNLNWTSLQRWNGREEFRKGPGLCLCADRHRRVASP